VGVAHYGAVGRVWGEVVSAAEYEHSPRGWFTPGAFPWCSCRYRPRNNAALLAHWAGFGIAWRDDHGTLVASAVSP